MHLTGFFRIGWTVQLLVGVALFSVSFAIENSVLQAFFAAPLIALTLAIALELGKAAAIVWHRYLSLSEGRGYPWQTRLFSATFRIGLVGLSVLCSLLYLGVQLDRPNLGAVRTAELAAIDGRLREGLQRLEAEHKARSEADEERRNTEYTDTRREHQRQVDELEALLRAEMDNVVGSVFKGPRYKEYQDRLTEARTARDAALASVSARHSLEAAGHARTLSQEHGRARQDLIADAERQSRSMRTATFDTDDRVNDPLVVGLIRMAAAVFDHQVTPPQFVFVFALFISLLMELGILLAFDTVTLAVIPALAAQHREAVMNEALHAEVSGAATREAMRHHEAVDRIRKGAERVMDKADAHARAQRAA